MSGAWDTIRSNSTDAVFDKEKLDSTMMTTLLIVSIKFQEILASIFYKYLGPSGVCGPIIWS